MDNIKGDNWHNIWYEDWKLRFFASTSLEQFCYTIWEREPKRWVDMLLVLDIVPMLCYIMLCWT